MFSAEMMRFCSSAQGFGDGFSVGNSEKVIERIC